MPSPTDWTPERWRHASDLLDALLDLPPEKRTAHLATVAETDSDLAADAARLLGRDASHLDRLRDALEQHTGDLLDELPIVASMPTAFGSYRVADEIGRGGMGVVYRCERDDGAFEQTVAVKVLHVGVGADVSERFRTEQRILARLDHPGIARLIDGGVTAGGQPFFVMDYVEGVPITEYASDKPLNERLDLFRQVCDAVHYAHQRLVIHRDLKPSNVLVTPGGQVKLLDFGIAKLIDADAAFTVPVTQPDARWMTPTYASPEQIRGDEPTTATDVYALGILLFELLTGRLPYDLPDRARRAAEHAILETAPHKPSTMLVRAEPSERALTASVRGDLDQVVLTALRKEPERRYESAAAFAADVGRWSQGEAVLAQPDTLGYRARTFTRRRRRPLLAGFGLLLLLTLVGVSYVRGIAESRDAATLRAQESEAALGFLSGIFEANDPERNLGDVPTARDLLDAASQRLAADSAMAPSVRVRVGLAMARAWESLGDPKRHEAEARSALHATNSDTLAALAMAEMATAALNYGNTDSARVRYEWAADAARRGRMGRPNRRAIGMDLISLYWRTNLLDSAQAVIDRLQTDALPSELAFQIDLSTQSGSIYRTASRFDEAEAARRRAYALSLALYGPDSLATARALYSVAGALPRGTEDRHSAILDSVAQMRTRQIEAGSPVTNFDAGLASMLAHHAKRRGDMQNADTFSARALHIVESIFGPDNAKTTTRLLDRCYFLYSVGRFEEAVAPCRRSVSIRQTYMESGSGPLINSKQGLAYVLLATGDCRTALDMSREILRDFPDLPNYVVAKSLGTRARSLTCLGRSEASSAWSEYVAQARHVAADGRVRFAEQLAEAIADSTAAAR